METAVDVRNARSDLSVEAPHLHEVYFARLVFPSRVPGNHLLALGADVGHHFRHESRVGESHLIGTDMEVRHIEGFAYLVHEELEDLHAFGALHVVTEGAHEGRTVSRHIDFRDEKHLTRLAIFHEFLGFFQGVIFARHAGHVLGIVQHREDLALQAPCLVFGEVPVEDIDLVTGKHVDFALQLVHGDVASSHILHESAHLEGRPVHDTAILHQALSALLHGQLAQGLHGPVRSRFGSGFDGDTLTRNRQTIGFVLIQFGTLYGWHKLHLDGLGGLIVHPSTQFGHQSLPFGFQHRSIQFHLIQQEITSLHFHLLGFRKQRIVFLCQQGDLSKQEDKEQKNGSFYHNIVFKFTRL